VGSRLDQEGRLASLVKMLGWRIAVGAVGTWFLVSRQGVFGLVWAAPLWGVLLARPIVESVSVLARGIKASALDTRGARLYTFRSHDIRVFFEDRRPWIVEPDLLAVLGLEPDPERTRRYDATEFDRIGSTGLKGFSEAGVLRVLAGSRHPDVIKLRLWLEREIFAPARRRRERDIVRDS
jgi:hypothetical protein